MRLIFFKTAEKKTHLGQDIRCYDGNTVDVASKRGMQLLKTYPRNFFELPSSYKNPCPPLKKQGQPLIQLNSTSLVSILIPQRGRPAQIKRCLELILANTSYPNYEVILICDRNDMDSVKDIPKDKRIGVVVDPSPTRQMFVGKANYGFKISKGEYIVYLGNDIEVGKNWLTEGVKALQGVFPDGMGVIGPNPTGPYHGLVSRKFIQKALHGRLFYPRYIHYHCDTELGMIAKQLNRFYWTPKFVTVDKCPHDELWKEGQTKTMKQGADLFLKRRLIGFPP